MAKGEKTVEGGLRKYGEERRWGAARARHWRARSYRRRCEPLPHELLAGRMPLGRRASGRTRRCAAGRLRYRLAATCSTAGSSFERLTPQERGLPRIPGRRPLESVAARGPRACAHRVLRSIGRPLGPVPCTQALVPAYRLALSSCGSLERVRGMGRGAQRRCRGESRHQDPPARSSRGRRGASARQLRVRSASPCAAGRVPLITIQPLRSA